MLEAASPRAANIAVALRIEPAAHAGVLPPSNCCMRPSSWPCTVAFAEGVAVAAWICSVNSAAFWALAEPEISSPASISRAAGASTIVASPWAAFMSVTLDVSSWAASTWDCVPNVPATGVSPSVVACTWDATVEGVIVVVGATEGRPTCETVSTLAASAVGACATACPAVAPIKSASCGWR